MSNYLSATDFDKWVNTMIADCKKASGLTPKHIDFVRRLDHGLVVGFNTSRSILKSSDCCNYAVVEGSFVLSRISDGIRITNIKNGKSASSHRNIVDKNDDKIALAVAWARYRKIDIPKVREYITKYNIHNIKSGSIIYHQDFRECELEFIAPDPMDNSKFIAREAVNGIYRYNTYTIGDNYNPFYVK